MVMRKRVALGMSGGVDSAVAAVVLLRAGYEVVGVTCGLLGGDADDRAAADARAVCDAIGIEHVVRRSDSAFRREVSAPFVRAYEEGLTPSPCPVCNARVKLPEIAAAADEAGCDRIATGHYARIARLEDSGRFAVLSALDARKDQSYMLALVGQDLLARLVLPLGGLTKTDVRLMAADLGLPVAAKPDSQDICFAPNGYRELLSPDAPALASGAIVDTAGRVIGRHEGLANYTIGQRKGIGVAGPEPYFVIAKRPAENELVVGFADEAQIGGVIVRDVVWQAYEPPREPLHAMVKLRYRSGAVACIIDAETGNRARVRLASPQPATAPGQVAVFSIGGTVIGGGTIEEVVRA